MTRSPGLQRRTPPTLQEQARALGDPTRYSIFEYVAEVSRPVDVAELTDHLGLHHNAIRQHLAKLVGAGLLVEEHGAPSGRGRPKLVYRLAPGAESRWGVVGPYEHLSVMLAEMLRTGDSAVDVGKRSVPRRLRADHGPGDPIGVVVDLMQRRGFDPEVRNARGSRVEVVLRTCPFASAVLADPDTVCDLHLGMAEGVAALTDDRVVVDELVAHDPRRANCRLRMHLEAGS
jgi:predicted ArsR family transcriptional regulator